MEVLFHLIADISLIISLTFEGHRSDQSQIENRKDSEHSGTSLLYLKADLATGNHTNTCKRGT